MFKAVFSMDFYLLHHFFHPICLIGVPVNKGVYKFNRAIRHGGKPQFELDVLGSPKSRNAMFQAIAEFIFLFVLQTLGTQKS